MSSVIELGEGFERKLAKVHVEIESLRKKKRTICVSSFLYTVLGCFLVISQRNLFDDFYLSYYWYKSSVEYLCIIFIGFLLIYLASNNLRKFKKKEKTIIEEKEEIGSILNKHQIKYECNVEFDKKQFGNHYAIVELKSNSKFLKDSKITFQI